MVLGCLAMGMTRRRPRTGASPSWTSPGWSNFIDYPMRTYSTGMAQRLRFSIASAKNHEILMIDEALATGDANFRPRATSGSSSCAGRRAPCSSSRTSLAEIEASCNQVIWLEKGKIMRQGYDVPRSSTPYRGSHRRRACKRDKPQHERPRRRPPLRDRRRRSGRRAKALESAAGRSAAGTSRCRPEAA
mgnify:CR=1 FL=1